MATKREKVAFSLPDHQILVPTTSTTALFFALSLYFLLIQNPNTPLAIAIKIANGVIQASCAFKYLKSPSPTPDTLFLASKVVIKGFRVSQRLIPPSAVARSSPSPIVGRKLKACVAAVNLLRYARHPPHDDMPLGLGFLNVGHKFSKNILRVVDAFIGLQLDEVIRRSVDALGLLFKAAVVVRVIGERFGTNELVWRRNSYGFWRVGDLRWEVCLRCKGSFFDRICVEKRLPGFRVLGFGDCDEVGDEELEVSVSELLSLSIPIVEEDSPTILQIQQLHYAIYGRNSRASANFLV